MNYTPIPDTLTVDQIWGAASQAQITNGAYIKEGSPSLVSDSSGPIPNRDIMIFLAYNADNITQESIDTGKEVRNYLKRDLLFRRLSDDNLGEYLTKGMTLASDDNLKLTYKNINYIASLPQGVARDQIKREKEKPMRIAMGGFLGREGDRLPINFTVVKSVYSIQWECTYVTGVTTQDQVVFFATKNKRLTQEGAIVSATASIRNHFTDSTTNVKMTRIHNVRLGIQ